MRIAQLTVRAATAIVLIFMLSACTSTDLITFVDEGNSYTTSSALRLAEQVSAEQLAQEQTADSQELREVALSSLRTKGDAAADAASLITRTLPAESRSVPFYVEKASFEGKTAILMIEAVGPSEGELTDKRLWVLSTEGDVLLSGSR